jgi:hypothetical protein
MYGNDATYNGYLAADPISGNPLMFSSAQAVTSGPFTGTVKCAMNIAADNPALYGTVDFTRWIVRFPAGAASGVYYVSESFEVIADDYSGANNARILYLVPRDDGALGGTANPAKITANGNVGGNLVSTLIGQSSSSTVPVTTPTVNYPFVLDGRYLRAFNGPGLSAPVTFYVSNNTQVTHPANVYGNFRVNGPLLGSPFAPLGDPDAVGMDEDYDACDLDNWFLAIQSADGQVVIPSFHRPAIIRADSGDGSNPPNNGNMAFGGGTDWNDFKGQNPQPFDSRGRILRPRNYDGHSSLSFPDLLPDSSGRITYDVDNDGDGVTDSVWLDLGYPAKRDPTGQLFKPLFSFLVIGLNGRLPLNTAGNLQDLNPVVTAGPPASVAFTTTYHASSHLGYSPSEVDPTYALQNAADPTLSQYSQLDNANVPVNLTQLRNILTGTRPQDNPLAPSGANGDLNFVMVNGTPYYLPNGQADQNVVAGNADSFQAKDGNGNPAVARNVLAVAGRWGESDFVPGYPAPGNVLVAGAGYTTKVAAGLSLNYSPGSSVGIEDDNYTSFDPTGRSTDWLDSSGSLMIPSERFRRFTTPVDLTGNGLVVGFNNPVGVAGGGATGNGPDNFGRVMFQQYFRPNSRPTTVGNGAPVGTNDGTTNPLHGFDAARNPLLTVTGDKTQIAASATGGKGVRLGQNEADEMRLYTPNEYDSGFDVSDLQWLYRLQDTDGATLTSRLSSLAPVSFLNPKDGTRRRRLFSLDAWETTNFAWAPDNPNGAFPDNSRFGVFASQFNSGAPNSPVYLPVTANASFANLNLTQNEISSVLNQGISYPFGFFSPLYNVSNNNIPKGYGPNSAYGPANTAAAISPDPTPSWPAHTPPLAHRDRKINLNYPLPVSNDPNEPVRQKWIREAYYLLKSILPPQSIDTPAECAKLSQFAINIIDFRDPDGTATHWVNPDVKLVPPYVDSNDGTPYMPQLVFSTYSAQNSANGEPPAVQLDQFGMEYLPVAINEVLAYSFLRKDYDSGNKTPVARPTNRFFVELVNTLTQSASTPNSTAATPDASDAFASGSLAATTGLDLTNWDIVIAEDDVFGRPDPTSGQLLTATNTQNEVYGPVPLAPASFLDFTQGQPATNPSFPSMTKPPQYINIPAVGINTATKTDPNAIATPISGSTQPISGGSTTATGNQAPQWPWGAQPSGSPASTTYPATAPNQSAYNYFFVLGNLLPVIPVNTSSSPESTTNPDYTGNAAGGGGAPNACENNPPLLINPIPDQMATLIDGQTAKTKSLPETDLFDSPYSAGGGATSVLTNSGQTPGSQGSGSATSSTLLNSGLFPIPQIKANATKYMWLYLRRPANPFAPGTGSISTPGSNPMVVVDCIRFPYIESGGTATGDASGKLDINGYQKDGVSQGTNQIYSIQRLQPFRGGHAVSNTVTVSGTAKAAAYSYNNGPVIAAGIIPAYGYGEQTAPATTTTSNPNINYGIFGNKQITANIQESLGQVNSTTEPWDYFPFNDRDFVSVAELTLVPGCPPGLFTKQFVENAPLNFTVTAPQTTPPTTAAGIPIEGALAASSSSPVVPHVYPYLVDNFFYTAGSPQNLNPVGNQGTVGPMWPKTGGPTGAGWHKMFEFFEVPSPAFGAIDTVANGMNYDWGRQDTKPGLLNLNLIIDEEVWLGLMGNLGLPNDSRNTTQIPMMNSVQIPDPVANGGVENGTPLQNLTINMTTANFALVPHVVTLTDLTGSPYAYSTSRLMTYPMSNVGFFTADPLSNNANDNRMKGAFSDFLKLRHGGSGYVFAWGTGPVGNVPGWPTNAVAGASVTGGQGSPAAERPFRALSFPDIDYTVMRPAALPPPPSSAIPAPSNSATQIPLQVTSRASLSSPLYWDPGVKDPYAAYPYTPATGAAGTDTYPVASNGTFAPPDIPPRRLFQIPDAFGSPTVSSTPPFYSNASLTGTGNPTYNGYVADQFLTNSGYDLTAGQNVYLGNASMGAMAPPYDNRQHPYFRTEWLQKVMNLTTVRTHQYAVWITVAFFQVTKQGDPSLASDTNYWAGAVDILGDELNVSTGRNTRYRSFFLLDRTRATGFNPAAPGDFRNVVVYRQTIQ